MATVKYDIIDGTTLEQDGLGVSRATRRCIVTDVDLSGDSDPIALYRSIQQAAGMPQFGDGHPADSKCRLQRHIVRGISNNGFVVDLVYEKLFMTRHPPVQGYFVITRSSMVTSYRRNNLPDGDFIMFPSRKLMEVEYLAPSSQINMRGIVPYRTNMVEIGDYRMAMSTQLEDMEACVGAVNADTWSGRRRGSWLCAAFGTNVDMDGESMSVEASFITTPGGWSIYGEEHDATGRAVESAETLNEEKRKLQQRGYEYGVILGDKKVVMKVGMYPVADFRTAFGFG